MAKAQKRYSRAIERNLLAVYYRANSNDLHEGFTWYQTANEVCQDIADKFNIELPQVCGVLAALSPGRQWSKNVEDTETLISAWSSGARGRQLPQVGTYGHRNVAKSIRILEGAEPLDILGGSKVRSFYANVLGLTAEQPVTIDRHAKCAAYNLKSAENSIVRESEYGYLSAHYRKAAFKVEVSPHQFQAVVWVCYRRLNGNLNQLDLLESGVPF